MPPIRLIASDLDRTLLRDDKSLSEYSAGVLQRCRERGIKIVFATARPKNRIDILPFTDLADAAIVNNGSAIYVGQKLVHRFGISARSAGPLMQRLAAAFPGRRLSIEYGDLAYSNNALEGIWEAEIRYGFNDLPKMEADKIVLRAGPEDLAAAEALLPGDCCAKLCENRLILITAKSAGKWNAIRAVAKDFGVSAAEIAAFGDDWNDLEMIQGCGAGVAVANALEEVKAAADFVCASNEEDGPAHWLEERLFC
jgi:Cof subfamily protein (haloacid dehalogenase superfamily)